MVSSVTLTNPDPLLWPQKNVSKMPVPITKDSYILVADNKASDSINPVSTSDFSAEAIIEFLKGETSKTGSPLTFNTITPENFSVDIGFPVVFQGGTKISIEVAREKKIYDDKLHNDALVVRWSFSKPLLGCYTIDAYLGFWDIFRTKKGREEKIKYEMHRCGTDISEGILDKVIRTSLAFDVVELILLQGEERPHFVLRNKEEMGGWGTWQQFKNDKQMCIGKKGLWVDNIRDYGKGWCKFWKLERVVDKLFYKYLEKHSIYKNVVKNLKDKDQYDRLATIAGVLNKILNTPYQVPCTGDDRDDDCWSQDDLKKMLEETIKDQTNLNDPTNR